MSADRHDSVVRVLAGVVGCDAAAIDASTHLRSDLGIDSMRLMTLMFMLEEALGVSTFDHVQEFVRARNVDDLFALVDGTSGSSYGEGPS